jgi:hypothetical protein
MIDARAADAFERGELKRAAPIRGAALLQLEPYCAISA